MPHISKDLECSDDGDLVVDETGDLKLSTPGQAVFQDIQFRTLTDFGDFEPDPYLAAALSRFKGKPNNKDVAAAIRDAVYYALTRDGRFTSSGVAVEVVPYGVSSVAIMIFVQDYILSESTSPPTQYNQSQQVVVFSYSMEQGLLSRITGVKE